MYNQYVNIADYIAATTNENNVHQRQQKRLVLALAGQDIHVPLVFGVILTRAGRFHYQPHPAIDKLHPYQYQRYCHLRTGVM